MQVDNEDDIPLQPKKRKLIGEENNNPQVGGQLAPPQHLFIFRLDPMFPRSSVRLGVDEFVYKSAHLRPNPVDHSFRYHLNDELV